MSTLHRFSDTVKSVPGTVIVDANSLYDTLASRTQPLQLQEKTALELLAYVRNTHSNNTATRWVHSEANVADGLTKSAATKIISEFMLTSEWSLVYDDQLMSAKKRKTQRLSPLENRVENNFHNTALEALTGVWPDFVDSSEEEGY